MKMELSGVNYMEARVSKKKKKTRSDGRDVKKKGREATLRCCLALP